MHGKLKSSHILKVTHEQWCLNLYLDIVLQGYDWSFFLPPRSIWTGPLPSETMTRCVSIYSGDGATRWVERLDFAWTLVFTPLPMAQRGEGVQTFTLAHWDWSHGNSFFLAMNIHRADNDAILHKRGQATTGGHTNHYLSSWLRHGKPHSLHLSSNETITTRLICEASACRRAGPSVTRAHWRSPSLNFGTELRWDRFAFPCLVMKSCRKSDLPEHKRL